MKIYDGDRFLWYSWWHHRNAFRVTDPLWIPPTKATSAGFDIFFDGGSLDKLLNKESWVTDHRKTQKYEPCEYFSGYIVKSHEMTSGRFY